MPRNTLDGMPRPTHAAQLAIALVALLRILLWYADPADERRLPAGPGSDLISASFAARDCTRKIVVMGSSQLLYGVLENRLAYAWNLPEDSVVNVSLHSSTTFDLRRQIELLMASPCAPSLVIADVSWRMFNSNRIPPLSQRFFALASIDERVRVEDMSLRARVLFDWIVGDQRHRRTIIDWGLALTKPRPPRWKADPRLFWTASEMRRHRTAREFTVERIAEAYLSSPAFSVRDVENLQSAIRLLHQRCAAVVLLHTPTKAEYRQSLRATEQGRRFERIYRTHVLSQNHTGADQVLVVENVESIGLDETALVDYGHLTPEGARHLTDYVARNVSERWRVLQQSSLPCVR